MGQSTIAILPARGGSKRLPRKNILPINGHPIISYSIRAALRSGLFDDVVVSTDDIEISEIAKEYGATIVQRPVELGSDQATVVDVCLHVLRLHSYRDVQRFCCIYATAPFLRPLDISESLQLMESSPPADYVMGVSTYNYHPVQALKEEGGLLSRMWPDYEGLKSQEYPEAYVSNGTLYWARTKPFQRDQTFYGDPLKGYLLRAVDIDTRDDYEKAKAIAEQKELSLT